MTSIVWWVKGSVLLSVLAIAQAVGQTVEASELVESNLRSRNLPRPAKTLKEWRVQRNRVEG